MTPDGRGYTRLESENACSNEEFQIGKQIQLVKYEEILERNTSNKRKRFVNFTEFTAFSQIQLKIKLIKNPLKFKWMQKTF